MIWQVASEAFAYSIQFNKARFPLPELTGDRFPLPVNVNKAVNSARQLG